MPRVEVAERAGVGLDGAVRPTEDVVLVRPEAVIMLDGATSLRADLPGGGWYAHRLAAAIADGLDPEADLADLLAGAISLVGKVNGFTPGNSPSSTVALLRWTEREVEALVLGDSPVIAFGPHGTVVLADDRLATVPRRTGGPSYRTQLRDGGGFGPDHVRALRSSGATVDQWRNREGGFWVAEADPAAAYQARRARWPRAGVHTVLMATDGVSCGVDDYRIFPDWPAVLDLIRRDGPQAVLDQVREAERSDPDGTRWPRPKPHDDQALVVVDLVTGETSPSYRE